MLLQLNEFQTLSERFSEAIMKIGMNNFADLPSLFNFQEDHLCQVYKYSARPNTSER